jgi:hypothetical protein
LEDLGYSVYLDWRDDPTLDRKRVSPATAAKLRERMSASKSLFYSTTVVLNPKSALALKAQIR